MAFFFFLKPSTFYYGFVMNKKNWTKVYGRGGWYTPRCISILAHGPCYFLVSIALSSVFLGWSRGARYQRGTRRSWLACTYVLQKYIVSVSIVSVFNLRGIMIFFKLLNLKNRPFYGLTIDASGIYLWKSWKKYNKITSSYFF